MQLRKNFFRCFRHKALKEGRADADTLDQMIQHGFKPWQRRFLFCKNPRRRFINILVAAFKQIENLCHSVRHAQLIHFCFHCRRRPRYHGFQIFVNRFRYAAVFHNAAEIFIAHGNRSVDQISQRIGKIGIHALHHQLPGNDSVVVKRHFMQYKIAHRVHAEKFRQFIRIEHISFGLAHLAVSLEKPGMSEYLFRERKV